jgi:uncharacterized membrane protein
MDRDIFKTLTFLVVHLGVAFSVAYALTGSIQVAGGIALLEPVANAFAFYIHEKLWKQKAGPALRASVA